MSNLWHSTTTMKVNKINVSVPLRSVQCVRWRRAKIVHKSQRENDALALKGHMQLLYAENERFLVTLCACGTYFDITS